MSHSVYVATHVPSGSFYVGKARDPEVRWSTHVAQAPRMNTPLSRLIQKNGPGAFSFRVVSEHATSIDASVAERDMISNHARNPLLLNDLRPVYRWEDFMTEAERLDFQTADENHTAYREILAKWTGTKDEIRRKCVQRARNALNKQLRAAHREKSK